MISKYTEKRILQFTILLGCLVPITAGIIGGLKGTENTLSIDLDSHYRYLSGLLFALGLGFLSAIPGIEYRTGRIRLLTFTVVIGGICRLIGFISAGIPSSVMCFALFMELVVTPLICLWQYRLAKLYK